MRLAPDSIVFLIRSSSQLHVGSSPDLEMKEEDEEGKPAWAGDQIPPEELEQVRKKFRLTPEQMKQVVETSRQQAAQQITSSSWTPHQKLNTVVYVIMLSVLVYVLNRDYGNLATIWFVQTFPKEAHTLGLIRHP
jgi:hypothetical protein